MTATLISLISIFTGIFGANIIGFYYKKQTLGFIGNTISGVFGSVFLIKSFGRLGFNPTAIMKNETINLNLFVLNFIVSLLGGILAVIIIKLVKEKI